MDRYYKRFIYVTCAGMRITHGRVWYNLSICPKIKQIIYYSVLSFFIAYSFGQILFLLRLFFPALLLNPILPRRFQADAKPPCPVAAGHGDVLFVQHDGKGFG